VAGECEPTTRGGVLFGAAVLATIIWRRPIGAELFWRQVALAPGCFGAVLFWRWMFWRQCRD